MARALTIQSDFTGGEIDPKLHGRTNLPRYASGLATAKNVDIMVTGGATRRAGTQFIYNAGAGQTVRHIPLTILRTDLSPATLKGYVIEFREDNKIRFYVDKALILSGGVPYELTSPFTDADLSLIKYDQYNGELYLVHPDFAPQKISRVNDAAWTVVPVEFVYNAAASVTGLLYFAKQTPTVVANLQLNAVAGYEGQLVAVGNSSYILSSPDGFTWTARSGTKSIALNGVCWSGSQFVAVGSADGTDAYILTSLDGVVWTERANPKNFNLYGITWAAELSLFVAVGAADGTDAYILTSPDGITWTERANPKNLYLYSVCWNGTQFLAVGTADADSYIVTSPDGITWTEQTAADNQVLMSVCWSSSLSLYVAVSASNAAGNIKTSPDGITWTGRTGPKAYGLYGVAWDGTNFLAVGVSDTVDAYMVYSTNGTAWTERANPKNFQLRGCCWSGVQFVAVGAIDTADNNPYMVNSHAEATTAAAHGLKVGDIVYMSPAATGYDGSKIVRFVRSATQFSYRMTTLPVTPDATGSKTFSRRPWMAPYYPGALAFHDQRLLLARTKLHPQTIWGSETGDPLNLALGVLDNDPFEFTPSAANSPINALLSATSVDVLTNDRELVLSGAADAPLTPTSVQFETAGRYGSKDGPRPLQVGAEVLFSTRTGKRIRATSYEFVKSAYLSPNVSIMAEHLLSGGIVEMCYVSEPQGAVYALIADGTLVRIAYDREMDVVAFSVYETDGLFKGLCVILDGSTDQVWVSVERTIGGTAYTYIEVLDSTLNTDSAVSATDSPAKTTWTGLSHLEGEVVDVVADGVALTATVTSGQIVLATAALAVEVGMHYDSELYDLKPELPMGDGTTQGRTSVSVNEIIVRLYESRGCTVNNESVADTGTAFTGDKKVANLSSVADAGRVRITQTKPLPVTVLAIIKRVTVGD